MGKLTLNLANWTFIDYNEFNAAFNPKHQDISKALTLARKVIVDWDYDADLNLSNPFKKLAMGVPYEIIRTIIENANEVIEKGDESDVEVDLCWDWDRLQEFQEAGTKQQFHKVERMLHEVTAMKGTNPDKPLTFAEGVMMSKAFNKAHERMITGKN